MRQIEKKMCSALAGLESFNCGNTSVRIEKDSEGFIEYARVFLHGNEIYKAKFGENGFDEWFTLAGWNTSTTRRILRALGVDVRQKNGLPMYKGFVISSTKWHKI